MKKDLLTNTVLVIVVLLGIAFYLPGCSIKKNKDTAPASTRNTDISTVFPAVVDPLNTTGGLCEQLKNIELTEAEKKYRYKYVEFFLQKGFKENLIPFYPDVRLQLPLPNYKIAYSRVYIGKKSLNEINDYVFITIPFYNKDNICCCIYPKEHITNSYITNFNTALSKECGVNVYNLHQRIASYEQFLQLTDTYQDFMLKHELSVIQFPQAFTVLNNNTNEERQFTYIPLIPQRLFMQPCFGNSNNGATTSLEMNDGEKASNTIGMPKKEEEKTRFSTCCQAPPMNVER